MSAAAAKPAAKAKPATKAKPAAKAKAVAPPLARVTSKRKQTETYEPCSRAKAMRMTEPPFIGFGMACCDAKNCIIDSYEAHICLVGKGILTQDKIAGVMCSGKDETCPNQIHICCSEQLKNMKMSEIKSKHFDFYCPECAEE